MTLTQLNEKMKELIISPSQEGQKLERVLERALKNAPAGFLYKMLRKKNITLNGKKATGKEQLHSGDAVQIWFSDDTFRKFAGETAAAFLPEKKTVASSQLRRDDFFENSILYEDPHVLIVNKPSGVLTQKAAPGDWSLNEYAVEYLLRTGQTDPEKLVFIRPSACNRLDRNTSGIVTIGKTQQGLATLTALFRDRLVHKDYLCITLGHVQEELLLDGYLSKNASDNKAEVSAKQTEGSRRILTKVWPEHCFTEPGGYSLSLLRIRLFTGRTHQIRAHLGSIGYPILGDVKYGNEKANRYFRDAYGIRSQMLHAYRLEFPTYLPGPLAALAGKTFTARAPEEFQRILGELEI